MIARQGGSRQVATLAIPTVEEIADATRGIPRAPYNHLGYAHGPRTFLTVSAGGVRMFSRDEAKCDESRIGRRDRKTREIDALVQEERARLNEAMALYETEEETRARVWKRLGFRGEPGSRIRPIFSWSRRSRARMRWTLGLFDYSPLFECEGKPAMLTLTAPGRYWQEVFPNPRSFKLAVYRLREAFESAWGQPMVGVWKMEFQKRGAPHLHILTRVLDGTAQRYTGRRGVRFVDRLEYKEWMSVAWALIVGVHLLDHEDAGAALADHVAAGTGVDYPEEQYRDPKRIATYFAKHGAFSAKEEQNQMPALWLDAIKAGEHSAQFWGSWGLERAESTIQLSERVLEPATRSVEGYADVVAAAWNKKGKAVDDFAIYMRASRLSLGLTLSRLAEELGVTSPYLSMIECGKRRPADELRERIVALLGGKDVSGIISGWKVEEDARWSTRATVGRAYSRDQVAKQQPDVVLVQRHLRRLSKSLASKKARGQLVLSENKRGQLVSEKIIRKIRGRRVDNKTGEIITWQKKRVGFYHGGSGFLSVNDGRVTADSIARILGGNPASRKSSYLLVA